MTLLPLFVFFEYDDCKSLSALFLYLPIVLVLNSSLSDFNSVALPLFFGVSFLSFFYNLAHYFLVQFTSAHYSVLVGSSKTIITVTLAFFIFGAHLLPINTAGIVITAIGFFMYNYFRFHELKREQEIERERSFTDELHELMTDNIDECTSDSDLELVKWIRRK
jgi:hypothetical protein